MSTQSPFTLDRFEYEAEHLYFLEPTLLKKLEKPKPVYIVGSRGTGKTTLLKALNWQERTANSSLRRELNDDPFSGAYLGLYIKLPEIQLETLSAWLAEEEDDQHSVLLSFYLDLIWIDQACLALSELIADEIFDVGVDEEEACISSVCEDLEQVIDSTGTYISPRTLKELRALIRRVRTDLDLAAKLRRDPKAVIEKLRIVTQVGQFGSAVAAKLISLCRLNSEDNRPWHFKICMDEGECLSEFQQIVLNTMLRLAKAPVFPVVSFVGMPRNISKTLLRNLTLAQADRELIPLDDIGYSDFQKLAEGVASVRVRRTLGDPNVQFDTRKVLGTLDINGMLHRILTESVSRVAKELLTKAKDLAKHPLFSEAGDEEQTAQEYDEGGNVPIYQAYLVQKLLLQLPDPSSPRWQKRKQSSAELRKKNVAAYLSICREIRAEPRYASADMVFRMSDMCVRDYLHQIDEIFQRSGKNLSEFIGSRVSVEIQDRALKAASQAKRESIPHSGVSSPGETGIIIKGLAQITAILQRESSSLQHLKSSERGIFIWNEQESAQDVAKPMLVKLREAAEAGFLRLLPEKDGCFRFQVHKSLAAIYGFSYRGAYYPCQITLSDLNKLRSAQDESTIEAIGYEIVEAIEGQKNKTIDIFSHMVSENDYEL